jgi:hypothetical protein
MKFTLLCFPGEAAAVAMLGPVVVAELFYRLMIYPAAGSQEQLLFHLIH